VVHDTTEKACPPPSVGARRLRHEGLQGMGLEGCWPGSNGPASMMSKVDLRSQSSSTHPQQNPFKEASTLLPPITNHPATPMVPPPPPPTLEPSTQGAPPLDSPCTEVLWKGLRASWSRQMQVCHLPLLLAWQQRVARVFPYVLTAKATSSCAKLHPTKFRYTSSGQVGKKRFSKAGQPFGELRYSPRRKFRTTLFLP